MSKPTPNQPTTQIGSTHSDTDTLTIRGLDTLSGIVGEKTFTETFFFIVTGTMPTPGQTTCFDACLNILMDHGLTPSALVARLTEDSVPEDMQVAISAGLLLVANRHVGTMSGAGHLLADGIAVDGDPERWAADIVTDYRAQKKRIPGFGHPHYFPEDPRAARLFEIAEEAGCGGQYMALMKLLEQEIERAMGRRLVLNVTGAMAAVLSEIGFPVEGMRGVAVVGRAAGLVAHIVEEKNTGLARHLIKYADQTVDTSPAKDM
ncbi:MAG: citryl-CoA lyase [Alphaproteobacteria bacterium]|nr:citryl-CoA lyase [Alphaproteobacteria bacterium]